MVQVRGHETAKKHGFMKFIDEGLGSLMQPKIRHKIATNIGDIKSHVTEVHERRLRYIELQLQSRWPSKEEVEEARAAVWHAIIHQVLHPNHPRFRILYNGVRIYVLLVPCSLINFLFPSLIFLS